MKIQKLGHCCLVIEHKGKRILTDPGSYTVDAQAGLTGIDFILFTHEHQDHYHLESLQAILKNNRRAVIFANNSVSELLAKENIAHTLIKHKEKFALGDIPAVGIGEKHAILHRSIPQSNNLGFFIDGRLWYPGDAFTDPKVGKIEILALPIAGPWMKISEGLDYAIDLKPQVAFPVHDGTGPFFPHMLASRVLPNFGMTFVPMVPGDTKEF